MKTTEVKPKPKKRSLVFSFIKFCFFLFLMLTVIVAGAVIGVVKTFSDQLPEVGYHTYKPKLNTKVYDINNEQIAEFHEVENRTEKVKMNEVSLKLQQAFLAIEDTRFYDHYGIDFVRIIGAAVSNWRSGGIRQGASTITQQLARNAFLTQEQTFSRKIKEILLAFKIEQKFSKQEIFELYLNEIYFGHGAWGVASAADIYFGKKPADLSLAEAAILAGLPKNPSRNDPFVNPKRAKERQVLVLNKMAEHNFITKQQASAAKDMPLHLKTTKKEITRAPYFVEYVRTELINKFGPKKVYTSGLKVYTTIDAPTQKAAEEAFLNAKIFMEKPLDTYPTMQGALIALDPQTGHIKAMVGGRSYEQSEFNRAVQAKRQPGSTFKTFIYTAAIQMGMSANSVMTDEPIEKVNPYTGKVWRPTNYENRYLGNVTLKTALEKSLNSIAVKLLEKVGIQRVIDITHKMGIKSQMGNNLSLALGACDVTPMEMASSYGVIANGGIRVPPMAIIKVIDNEGNILYDPGYRGEKVLEPETAFVMTEMMRGVIEQGTGTSAKIGRPAAGKTGTTNNYIDAWFVGFTPNLVTAIYVGNDDRKPLGHGKSGGRTVGPVWREFMLAALKDKPVVDFKEPSNIVKKFICRETGLLACETCTKKNMQSFKRGFEPESMCSHGTPDEGIDDYFISHNGAENNIDYTEDENDYSDGPGNDVIVETEDSGAFDPGAAIASAPNKKQSGGSKTPAAAPADLDDDEITADDDESE
jgi:penicillin-binding protein 1A